MADEDEEDCWDAFGSSSDEESDEGSDHEIADDEDRVAATTEPKGNTADARAASSIAMHLSQAFVKHNPQIRLPNRSVAVVSLVAGNGEETEGAVLSSGSNGNCVVSKHLEQRQMRVVRHNVSLNSKQSSTESQLTTLIEKFDAMADALIVLEETTFTHGHKINDEKKGDDTVPSAIAAHLIRELIDSILCPGGVFVFSRRRTENGECSDIETAAREQLVGSEAVLVHRASLPAVDWVARHKKTVRVHASTCPWLDASHSVAKEEDRLHLATVPLASHEMASSPSCSDPTKPRRSARLTEHSIRRAVRNLQDCGYCVLPGFLDPRECKEWGSAVLDCVHEASRILLERDGVDIYHPQSSDTEPQSYRELSMREDLRMDLRDGPALAKLRARKEGSSQTGGKSIVLSASEDHYGDGLFLRGHPSLLEIIRRTMNPGSANDPHLATGGNHHKNPLYLGNIGRWNFGGRGNDGSYQDLRVSPVGGIVSLPGSADQALHADTPHLFEHLPDLPAHYVNAFAPCTEFDPFVGGTAFVHGSHNLAFTAQHYEASHNASFYPFLVRPRVSVGDVILFDCRILHFGLANTSRSTERCICYVNTWQDWFHDAKNWDKNRAIFEPENETKATNER